MNALIVLGIITLFIYAILVDGTFFKIYIPLVVIYWFVSTVIFKTKDRIWKRRRIAMASWSSPSEPTSYLPYEYDVTETMDYIEKFNRDNKDGAKLTMTSVITKGLAIALNESAEHVGRISFGNFRPVKQLDIAVLCDVEGGKDLVPVNIKTPYKSTLSEISQTMKEKAMRAKTGKDEQHNKNFALIDYLPSFIVGVVLSIVPYISLNLGWSIPAMGIKGDAYSPVILTNVGALGLTAGFAPMNPMLPMLTVCMGKVVERPWVVNGDIKIRKILTIVYSFDHRVGDAAITVKAVNISQKVIENPQLMESLEYDGDVLINREFIDDKKQK